jgi:hypothetical protein
MKWKKLGKRVLFDSDIEKLSRLKAPRRKSGINQSTLEYNFKTRDPGV